MRLISVLLSTFALTLVATISGCSTSDTSTCDCRTVDIKSPLVTLEQGWTDSQAEWFYNISQGSQLIPYDWMVFLETAEGSQSFIDSIPKFGFIPRAKSGGNPYGLPVGFVKDVDRDRSWVGLTCAACHTGLIEYGGSSYLVDGAPTLGDAEGFLKALASAIQATHDDEQKFDRFAKNVLDPPDDAERQKLKEALQRIADVRKGYNDRNLPQGDQPAFGPGRVDALGAILNEVTVRFLDFPANHRVANAPVSYPFLWDAPHHDRVQWNGAAPNGKVHSLARNVGEVLGVFGNIEIPTEPPTLGYASTVQIQNLRDIESLIWKLKSPQWPKEFGELDEKTVARGRKLYDRHCSECHSLDFKRDDEARRIVAQMANVQTDSLTAKNFRTRQAVTGRLKGSKINFVPFGPEFVDTASGDTILIHEVVGTILGGWKAAPDDKLADLKMRGPILKADDLDQYKARPLNGIWATAPYLHNGSVPTLRELLKPANLRLKKFWVGSRKFNPKDIGFETGKSDGAWEFDTSIEGNSKDGHEYGTDLTKPEDIEDLLAFLKSQ